MDVLRRMYTSVIKIYYLDGFLIQECKENYSNRKIYATSFPNLLTRLQICRFSCIIPGTNLVSSITLSLNMKKQDLKKTRLVTKICFS